MADLRPPTFDLPAAPAIELRNVSLSFDDSRVLSNVSFRGAEGGTVMLLGVTGSGKSVTLKLMLGLLKPDSGEILIEGHDIVPLPETELNAFRKRMGVVFQEGALFDSLSVYENVSYRLREEGETDELKMEQRVREVLGFVDLEEAIGKMPAELSGGMRRRVAIARAIASRPRIMLYDSPTGGLDPVTSQTINLLITKLRDGERVTSVVVTQRLQDAFLLANFVYSPETQSLAPRPANGGAQPANATRFLVLRDGELFFEGSQDELRRSPDPYLQRFLR